MVSTKYVLTKLGYKNKIPQQLNPLSGASFSSWTPGIDARAAHVGFVVDTVT
jgi:hypothetical protein